MSITLTVFFEDPFWVGLFAVAEEGKSRYCKVTFGKEPSDAEIYEFCRNNFARLEFTDAYQSGTEKPEALNPKRRKRQIGRELSGRSGVRKSYEAIKESIQQNEKKARRKESKIIKNETADHVFQVKQQKHKEKHRGR
jgi:hypothetical protein